jgi:hypothetical protein
MGRKGLAGEVVPLDDVDGASVVEPRSNRMSRSVVSHIMGIPSHTTLVAEVTIVAIG